MYPRDDICVASGAAHKRLLLLWQVLPADSEGGWDLLTGLLLRIGDWIFREASEIPSEIPSEIHSEIGQAGARAEWHGRNKIKRERGGRRKAELICRFSSPCLSPFSFNRSTHNDAT